MRETFTEMVLRRRFKERLRGWLLAYESPRLQMAALVAFSGGAGFLASVSLLHLGLEWIPLRYVLAVSFAYVVFLALLYGWIRQRRRRDRDAGYSELVARDFDGGPSFDPAGAVPRKAAGDSGFSGGGFDWGVPRSEGTSGGGSVFSGGGGRFGGGGASGAWEGPRVAAAVPPSSSDWDGLDLSFDVDEGAMYIVLAIAALLLLAASIWIVVTAPSLFAELLLDGGLSAALYRRLGRIPHPWLDTALKKTLLPFFFTALILGATGVVMWIYAPEARSLGGVLAHSSQVERGTTPPPRRP